jgi:hypothetical protein
MVFDTHELDLENAIDRLYVGRDDFYELTQKDQQKKVSEAKNSVQFAALNYIHTGKGINGVANYINKFGDNKENKPDCDSTFYKNEDQYLFGTSTAVGVNVVKEEIGINKKFENTINELGYNFVKAINLEFFEGHYASELLMKDWDKGNLNPLETLYANDFRLDKFNGFNCLDNMTPAKYSFLKLMCEEELDLVDFVGKRGIDSKKFTGFKDEEKIHFRFLVLNDKYCGNTQNIITPYFIGIGNNYPFTRALQKKSNGDNRFYREKFDDTNGEYIFQHFEHKDGKWKNNIKRYDMKKSISLLGNKIMHRGLEKRRIFDLLDKSQKVYGDYFTNVFDIDKLMEEFSEKKGIKFSKYEKNLNHRLMLNPSTRLRSATVVAKAYLEKFLYPQD